MRDFHLNIGEVEVQAQPAIYTCRGLGSCVGLFLQDRLTGHSGGAHIFLPNEEAGNLHLGKFCSVRAALDELLARFARMGTHLTSLRAKIVGGANVLSHQIETGSQNASLLINELIGRKIFLAASDVGGNYCRTARFNSLSGELFIRASTDYESKTYLI